MNCRNCNNVFTGKDKRTIFCSQSCAATYNNKLRETKLPDCLECGKSLRGTGRGRLYCSKLCELENKKKSIDKSIEEYLGDVSDRRIKSYLIEKHGEKCMHCGWNKKHPVTGKVPIELEHVDGNSKNQSLSNLKLLCPNCHSLTPTFRALNKGNGRKNRK